MTVAAFRLPVVALSVALFMTGCSTSAAPDDSVAPPSATPLSAQDLAEAPLVDTSWSGIDSAGDATVLTLESDHTITVDYNGETWNDPGDIWQLSDGVLTMSVRVNDLHGALVYTALYTEGAMALEATAVTTASGRTLTIALTRQ